MAHTAKHLVLTLAAAALLSAPFADAAKFGGGKSSGMQRSTPSKSQSYNSTPAQQAPAPSYGKAAPNGAQPRSSGVGVGTAVAAGVAGAAAGYMLGSAMSDNNHSAPQQAQQAPAQAQASGSPMPAQQAQAMTGAAPAAPAPAGGGMPWGTLLLLAALLGGGAWWMLRRKSAPALGGSGARQNSARDNLSQYNGGPRDNLAGNQPVPGTGGGLFNQYNTAPSPLANGRLPDGTEAPHFLRQAKATFMHLQSMNNPANVHEVAKYLTPEMFAAVKAEVSANSETADFPTLNCDLLDAVEEHGRYIASVRFHGMVSESVNAPLAPFSEVWHYVKGTDTDNKWLVAGIQQEG